MTASIASYDERDREAVVRRRVQGMNGGSGKPAERLVGTAGGVGTLAALDAERHVRRAMNDRDAEGVSV